MGGLSPENGEYAVDDDDVEDCAGEECEQTAAEFEVTPKRKLQILALAIFPRAFVFLASRVPLETLGCPTRQSTEWCPERPFHHPGNRRQKVSFQQGGDLGPSSRRLPQPQESDKVSTRKRSDGQMVMGGIGGSRSLFGNSTTTSIYGRRVTSAGQIQYGKG